MENNFKNLRQESMIKDTFKIIFMGTPEFAVESLKLLVENDFNIVAVITAPDKPAGRGKKITESEVKKFAKENNIKLLQPTNLKNEQFLEDLKLLNADLQIVVAFRMLPEIVWSMPKYGTINLHASLLPNYRGAAPINHAIMNGETVTGVTTFFIEKEIDTGQIIFQEKLAIKEKDTAGDLHDKLMILGGKLVLKTVETIIKHEIKPISQETIIDELKQIKQAHKIFKEDCEINWKTSSVTIYNFIRGLSPYPTAWSKMVNLSSGKEITVKIFESDFIIEKHDYTSGSLISDDKTYCKISTDDGYIKLKSIQLEGKKRMQIKDLLNGYIISEFEIKKA